MTLQINVNLPPRLIERAREQQSERRLAAVASQRRAVVRQEAARQLTVQRALAGKDAQGKDLRAGAVADDRRRRPVLAHQAAKSYLVAGYKILADSFTSNYYATFSGKVIPEEYTDNGRALRKQLPATPHREGVRTLVYIENNYVYNPTLTAIGQWTTNETYQYIAVAPESGERFDCLLPVDGNTCLLCFVDTRTAIYQLTCFTEFSYANFVTPSESTYSSNTAVLAVYELRSKGPEQEIFLVGQDDYRKLLAPPGISERLKTLLSQSNKNYGFPNGETTASVYISANQETLATFAGKPKVGIAAEYTSDRTAVEFPYSRSVNESTGDPLDYDEYGWAPSANKKRNPKSKITLNGDVLILTWDCGQPTYCRESLLALGFSESDLTL